MIHNDAPIILVCVDSSSASVMTLSFACNLSKRLGFSIQILSVLESSHKNLLFGSQIIGKEKRSNLEAHLKKLLDNSYKTGCKTPVVTIREGDVTTEILRELKQIKNCAMLVIGKSSSSAQSDNSVLPKLVQKLGKKNHTPIIIVPENLDSSIMQEII